MKAKTLTAIELKTHLKYDAKTGIFTRNINKGKFKAGMVAGYLNKRGRVVINMFGGIYSASRLAWLYTYGEWPFGVVDHINGDPSDNRLCNLRDVSLKINQQNQIRAQSMSSSGVLGVSRSKTKKESWRAYIRVNGCQKYIGSFGNKADAANAYVAAKRMLHEGCTI